MATKRATKTARDAAEDEFNESTQASEAPPEFAPDDLAVSDLLAELGGDSDAAVRIYRQGKGGYRDLTLIDEVGVMEFTPLMLKHPPYNGGEFRIHARSKGGMICNRMLKVEPAPPAPVAPQGGVTLAQVADVVAQTLRGMQPAAPAPSRADMLAELRMMAEIMRPAPVETKPERDPLAMLETVINTASRLNDMRGGAPEGGTDTNTLLLGLIREFGPNISKAIAEAPRPAPMPNPAPPTLSAPERVENPLPPHVVQNAVHPEDAMNLRLKMGLQFLCMQAAAKNDAMTYADVVLDNVPEDDLRMMMDAPDYLERLAVFHPGVTAHAAWFGELRAGILEILNAPPESGNPADAGDNDGKENGTH